MNSWFDSLSLPHILNHLEVVFALQPRLGLSSMQVSCHTRLQGVKSLRFKVITWSLFKELRSIFFIAP